MRKPNLLFAALLAAISVLALVGCKKKEEPVVTAPAPTLEPTAALLSGAPRVERVTVVKSVNADDSPGPTAGSFQKNDTVYVSMWTAGAPVGTEIIARWFDPNGAQVTEDKIVTDKAGDGYTSFHAANTNGWAPGTYRVDILVNGQPAGTTNFQVLP